MEAEYIFLELQFCRIVPRWNRRQGWLGIVDNRPIIRCIGCSGEHIHLPCTAIIRK